MDVDTGAVAVTVAPLTAILERDGQTGVLVVDHGRLAYCPIKAGPNDGKRLAVVAGL